MQPQARKDKGWKAVFPIPADCSLHCQTLREPQHESVCAYLLDLTGIASSGCIQILLCAALIMFGCMLPHKRPHTQQITQHLHHIISACCTGQASYHQRLLHSPGSISSALAAQARHHIISACCTGQASYHQRLLHSPGSKTDMRSQSLGQNKMTGELQDNNVQLI